MSVECLLRCLPVKRASCFRIRLKKRGKNNSQIFGKRTENTPLWVRTALFIKYLRSVFRPASLYVIMPLSDSQDFLNWEFEIKSLINVSNLPAIIEIIFKFIAIKSLNNDTVCILYCIFHALKARLIIFFLKFWWILCSFLFDFLDILFAAFILNIYPVFNFLYKTCVCVCFFFVVGNFTIMQ